MDNEIVWRPTPEAIARARITRLMRSLGVTTLAELQRRSVEDPEWYWTGVVKDLGLPEPWNPEPYRWLFTRFRVWCSFGCSRFRSQTPPVSCQRDDGRYSDLIPSPAWWRGFVGRCSEEEQLVRC